MDDKCTGCPIGAHNICKGCDLCECCCTCYGYCEDEDDLYDLCEPINDWNEWMERNGGDAELQ